MPIYKEKTIGYRDIECTIEVEDKLSIAAINPPDRFYRTMPDRKADNDLTFHITIVNNKDGEDEKSAYIQLTKKQLSKLNNAITEYLKTGITKEL